MNPSDLPAKTELAYGGGIAGLSLFMHWLNEYVTPAATAIGAVAGAIVGIHAVYRLCRPRRRQDRRATDRG